MNRRHDDHVYNDPDSDLDLDLEELDPVTSTQLQQTHRQQRSSHEYTGRIPLRNLRFGGRRRPRQEEDDVQALIADEDGLSKREGHAEADAPLLAGGGLRRASQNRLGTLSSSQGWTGRLWRMLPFNKRHASITLPASAADGGEDDHDPSSNRTIPVAQRQTIRYPSNAISNAKYTPWSFLPRTLFNEFKFFFNMYFLLVALSQIISALRIGYLSTYIAPLAFVISVTLGKEAYDDLYRRKRDSEANGEAYKVLRLDTARVEGGQASKKRKISNISELKRGKRRRTDVADRVAELEQEEETTEDVEVPSASVVEIMKSAKDLVVGDVLVLEKNQRVPADVVILKSIATDAPGSDETEPLVPQKSVALMDLVEDSAPHAEAHTGEDLPYESTATDPSGSGEAFIRTDQLDGETDWKLRLATPIAQTLPTSEYLRLRVTAGKPDKRVNDFVGTIELLPKHNQAYDPPPSQSPNPAAETRSAPLTIDNTAWANTVLASSTTVHAAVLYTGPQTRAALSTSSSRSKTGLLELEIDSLVKILCVLTAVLSFALVAFEGFDVHEGRPWYVAMMRFLILFSTIVPISLRVNLDMGKSMYAGMIHRDAGIPETVVRTSTIPEDLGRIEYLLTDKTGTLTRNEMELKKVHVGTIAYGSDSMEEVRGYVAQAFGKDEGSAEGELWTPSSSSSALLVGATRTRREIATKVRDLVLTLALCHSVTPTVEDDADGNPMTSYQASSPDEVAIVQWTEAIGLRLAHRDRKTMTLHFAGTPVVKVDILNIFPFTSDSKRMAIVVRFYRSLTQSGDDIVFYQKGADTVMASIVASNDWLDEETGNMAREGLRTLVIARKPLTTQAYAAFASAYATAALSFTSRESAMTAVVKSHLEQSLHILGITGVEDKLQPHVKASLELLRNAGLKIWMLTGDKPETARCIALASRLVTRGQQIHTITSLRSPSLALAALQPLTLSPTSALLIDGQSLAIYLAHQPLAFIRTAVALPAVIACRCTPMQKASLALLIRSHTKKRVCCIGDGGNDVSMIAAADVGVGIVGKEGRQASLAADFSLTQFAHLTKLLLWHGRNSYKRSAKLAQFVIHRGLIISVCQTVFSASSEFEPIALYRDWLLVGYATIYTMMPVFSLVLDRDVDEKLANLYPELYKELTAGKSLSYRTFFIWVAISVYQGIVIQLGAQLLAPKSASSAPIIEPNGHMLLLSYTALVLNELFMVAASVTTWHWSMWASILATSGFFFGSMPFLGDYFELAWFLKIGFWWRLAALLGVSLVPVWGGRVIGKWVRPPTYRKVRA